MWTVILLVISNVFMTFAWYGHLKFFKGEGQPMWLIVLFSWSIAFIEYWFAVPANRIGQRVYGMDTFQLKTLQEIITLIVFAVFAVLFLKEKLQWNYLVGFACLAAAGFFVFNPSFSAKRANVAGADATPAATYTPPASAD